MLRGDIKLHKHVAIAVLFQSSQENIKMQKVKSSKSCNFDLHFDALSSKSNPGHQKNMHVNFELWSASLHGVESENGKIFDVF